MARRAGKPLLRVDVLAVSLHADTQRLRQIGMALETGVLGLRKSYQSAANQPHSHKDCRACHQIANLNHAASLWQPAVDRHDRHVTEKDTSQPGDPTPRVER